MAYLPQANPDLARKLWIYTYWPNVNNSGQHLGLAFSRYAIILGAIGLTLELGALISLLVGQSAGLLFLLGFLLWILAMFLNTRYSGYYEVDQNGQPVQFISKAVPLLVRSQRPILGRANFIREIEKL